MLGFVVDVPPAWTDIVSAIALVAQLVLLAVAAGIALSQLGEARKVREGRARPFIIVDFEPDSVMLYLTIRNAGETMATDVAFTFDPPLRSQTFANQLGAWKFLSDGVPSFAPGKVIRTAFDHFPQREEAGGFEDVYNVTATYRSDLFGRTYTDRMTLDIGIYRNLMRVNRKDLHEIHDQVKRIADATHKWTDTSGAVKVMSWATLTKRGRAWKRRYAVERAAKSERRAVRIFAELRRRALRSQF